MIPPYSSNRLPSSSCGSSSVDDSLEGGEQSEVTAVECYGMKAGGKRRRGFLLSGVSSWLGLLSTRGRLVTWLTIDNRKRWLDACPTCMLYMATNRSGVSDLPIDCEKRGIECSCAVNHGYATQNEQYLHFIFSHND